MASTDISEPASGSIGKFDPELHRTNTHDAFCEFVSRFQYEYEAIARDPPSSIENIETWTEIHKRKVFLGRFSSRNFQKDFEDSVAVEERKNLQFKDLVSKMQARYEPTRNYTLANYQFHRIRQKQEESFDNFVHRLQHDASSCKFKCSDASCNVEDIMVRDQIIVGTTYDDIRNNALKNQWNLKEIIENGRKMEAAFHTAQCILDDSLSDDGIGISRMKPGKYSRKTKKSRTATKPKNGLCITCSSKACLGGKSCQAHSLTCFACGKRGHFKGSKACKIKKRIKRNEVDSQQSASSSVAETSEDASTSESDEEKEPVSPRALRSKRIHRIQCRKKKNTKTSERMFPLRASNPHDAPTIWRISKPRYRVKIVISEKKVKAFADTGADINVMSQKTASQLNLPLSRTKTKLRPYGSKPIKCSGYYEGSVMFQNAATLTRFYIIPGEVETLLSGRLCEELGIIKFNKKAKQGRHSKIRAIKHADEFKSAIIKEYSSVFKGVGTLRDHQVHFYIDNRIPPVAQASRPIPFHLREKFQRAISQMEEEDIIEEHTGPAPWVSNTVLTPKDNGDIRVTVDLRAVNKAIKATNIPIPRVEDIKAKLSSCKIFSKLDFKSAFHQLPLDEESRILTVFHAGQRLMRYKRLTMGAKPASGELTKALIPIFANMPSVHIIHDDLIIAGKTKSEHDQALHAALHRIKQVGMTLNAEKCILRKHEIPFWGMIVTKDGIKPDPEKVKSLERASRPRSKEEVMSFLCFVQSFGDFIPHLSRKTKHLRSLTKKDKKFKWSSSCSEEFKDLKQSVQKDTSLRFFDKDLPTFIFVDAHTSGLSSILAQGRTANSCKAVAFASRSTRPEEQRYPQLDLEAMAVDFGLRRFRNYIAGGPEVKIITDHKPLVSIFSNSRKGSIRTDRIKMRHQDLQYKVMWEPGKENPADYLSRHSLPLANAPKNWEKEVGELERTVFWLQYGPYTEAISMKKILQETDKDKTLSMLKKYITQGRISKNKSGMAEFRKFQDQLALVDGIIMKQDKIILPETLWQKAIDKVHQGGHPGINNLKRRIRSHFWIPGLNKMVEAKIKGCTMCQQFTNKGTKQPLKPILPPKDAWKEVSIDLFGPMPDQRHVVVVQDIKTRFPDAKIVNSTGARHVIPAIADAYHHFGRPDCHRSDNGPPFNSKEFQEFSEKYGIQHKTSYPYHPQANPVETFMKPLGKAMKIAYAEGKDKCKALNNLLMGYRSTPHIATGQSPGDLLFRGGYRQDFPGKVLSPQEIHDSEEMDRQQKMDRQRNLNISRRRQTMRVKQGDTALIRNYHRGKFDPLFGPDAHKIVHVSSDGVTTQRFKDGKTFKRHFDDIKICHSTANSPKRLGNRPQYNRFWNWDQPAQSSSPELIHQGQSSVPEEVASEDFQNEQEATRNEEPETNSSPPNPVPRALSRLADFNNPGYSEVQFH